MKVLITTSGTGSRLGELTRHTNKALVRLGRKPAISYIIESYPNNTEFVITLGYKGDQIKDFLALAYPERKFQYVWIDKYEGPGTSLGYSMLRAEKVLQEPFIFHACDTIVTEKIPVPKANWIGGYIINKRDGLEAKQYRTHKVQNHKILWLNDKGVQDFQSIHIGLIGVKDYKKFWQDLRSIYKADPENTGHSDVHVLDKMIKDGISFDWIPYKVWLDTGNPTALERTRKNIPDRFDNPDKIDESIFFFKDFVIKFFADPKKVKDRVARAKVLKRLVPKMLGVKKNFYKYSFVVGKRYSDVVSPTDIKKFLNWSERNLWKKVREVLDNKFQKICLDFYEKKTRERVQKFFEQTGIKDGPSTINGVEVPSLKKLLETVDWQWLSRGEQTGFHGDYILENILKTKSGYSLLDWRQDFGGLLKAGDKYYDLAKFYHNLVVNHDNIGLNKFVIEMKDQNVKCSIQRKKHLLAAEKAFEKEIERRGLDLPRIRVLRAIIWLNMSPLHHHPFNIFLFYFGKYHLWQALR